MTSKGDFTILVADDEEGMRFGLQKILGLEGYKVITAANGAEVRALSKKRRLHCAFVDLQLPDVKGIDLVTELNAKNVPVVIITAYATVDTAVKAMKVGAVDYIQKPFDNKDIVEMADRLCFRSGPFGDDPKAEAAPDEFVVENGRVRGLVSTVEKVKDFEIPVLLQGESGTGKEMFARMIHKLGRRKDFPFVAINCAAIPLELLESELFGHEKGSFTGAHATTAGKFELAANGTIFLDEIGEMSLALQSKLLRALEERSFEPVGSSRSIPFKARVIAATNSDIQELIRGKRFRLDLYYRLKGIVITIPPLRERRDDIEPLVRHFLDLYRTRYKKPHVTIAQETLRYLSSYAWPGNVRELKNAVESAVLLSEQDIPLLPHDFMLDVVPESLPDLWSKERDDIIEILRKTGFNRSNTALELGMSRKTLYNKMKKYGIH